MADTVKFSDDEMKKLPFVMVRLLTVGSDQVINSFQEVYNSIKLLIGLREVLNLRGHFFE